ncbi:MAG: putative protein family YabK [Firmicutes bacterium]|nr:putative protein family YabK [Bacillota bacterium]
MKINYSCDYCGEPIDTIEVEQIDEERLGFNCLNLEERQDLLKYDELTNSLNVLSLCDRCIEELGLADRVFPLNTKIIH